jgi:hypothetical protein
LQNAQPCKLTITTSGCLACKACSKDKDKELVLGKVMFAAKAFKADAPTHPKVRPCNALRRDKLDT